MKKSKNKLNEEELMNDIDEILNYANSLSTLDIENTDLNKMDKEIDAFGKNLKEKYDPNSKDLDFKK